MATETTKLLGPNLQSVNNSTNEDTVPNSNGSGAQNEVNKINMK